MSVPAPSRAEAIADQLRQQILSGKYEPGERLPSERELAGRTGANRTSVREALKQLEQAGMISIRRGDGARVLPLEETGLGVLQHLLRARPTDRDLLRQWLDVWELVLTGSARLAVERGTDAEFAEALRMLRRIRSKDIKAPEFLVTIDALTELVAVASRNIVLRMVRNGLTAQIQATRRGDVSYALPEPEVFVARVKELEAAVEARDPTAVAETLRALMRYERNAILEKLSGSGEEN